MQPLSNFLGNDMVMMTIQLLFATLLGGFIGIERLIAHKTAGIRTYALVSMGSCLFMLISRVVLTLENIPGNSATYIPGAIITGMGFLGGGLIIFQNHKLSGLTTAAGLWVAGGIGMAVALEQYILATIAAAITVFIFAGLWYAEASLKHLSQKIFKDDETH